MRVAGHDDDGTKENPDRGRDGAAAEAALTHLTIQAAAGDRLALNQLLALIRPPVVKYCRARIGDAIGVYTPEDIAQEILLAFCVGLARYRPGETAVMAFVYGIARNKVVDAFRADGRDRTIPTDTLPDHVDDRVDPEAVTLFGSEVAELRDLLELLSPVQQEVLVLRIGLAYSAEETARIVDSTPGAVRVIQHRALIKLRVLLAQRLAGEPT